MQAAPKTIGQVPYRPQYPQKKSHHPSRQSLPQRKTGAKKRVKTGNSFFSFLIIVSLVLAPLALVNLSIRAVATENMYRIQRIKNDIVTEKSGQERMRLDLANLTSPERIQRMATERLAMTVPAEVQFISLPDGTTSPKSVAYLDVKEVR